MSLPNHPVPYSVFEGEVRAAEMLSRRDEEIIAEDRKREQLILDEALRPEVGRVVGKITAGELGDLTREFDDDPQQFCLRVAVLQREMTDVLERLERAESTLDHYRAWA